MAPKRKLKQTTNYDEMSKDSSLSSSNKKISPKCKNEEVRKCFNFYTVFNVV